MLQSFGVEAVTAKFEGPLPTSYQPCGPSGCSWTSSVKQNQQNIQQSVAAPIESIPASQQAAIVNTEGSGLFGHSTHQGMHWQSAAAAASAQAAEAAVARDSEMHPRPSTASLESSGVPGQSSAHADVKMPFSQAIQGPSA